MNRKGNSFTKILVPIIVVAVIIGFMVYLQYGFGVKIIPTQGEFSAALSAAPESFGTAFASSLTFFDFIFGKIPGHLSDVVDNGVSRGLVIIAIWFIFFLMFADIMSLYGGFSTAVNWVVAGLLALILANVKVIAIVTVYALTVLAIFGSFSIILSIASIFGLFILFHFGSHGVRNWIQNRRSQDAALAAQRGARRISAGADVLAEAARAGERAA